MLNNPIFGPPPPWRERLCSDSSRSQRFSKSGGGLVRGDPPCSPPSRDFDRQPTNADFRAAMPTGHQPRMNHAVSDLQQALRAISAPFYGQSGRRCDFARLRGAQSAIRNSAKNSPISGRARGEARGSHFSK